MSSMIQRALDQPAPPSHACKFCHGEPDFVSVCDDCQPDFEAKKLGVCPDCNTIFDQPGNVQCDCYAEAGRGSCDEV